MLKEIPNGILLDVLASPGASVSKVRGIHAGALKVAVRSAPEKGKANAELEAVLAEFFNVSKKQVSVVSGETSRNKKVQVLWISRVMVESAIQKLEE